MAPPFVCSIGSSSHATGATSRSPISRLSNRRSRDNRRHPARLLPNLLFRPHIKKWIASPFDPRIHFALNCGAQSCPPIAVYTPVEIDAQLDQAVAAFLDGETTIDTATQTISANPILRWYRADFGDLEGWIRRHRSDGLPAGRWHFKWNPYDWSV